MKPTLKLILAASIGVNLVFLTVGAYAIYTRGGSDYLRHLASPRIEADEFPGAYWSGRQSHFTNLQTGVPEPIVFVGDSLAEGGEWSALFSGSSRIVNRGI